MCNDVTSESLVAEWRRIRDRAEALYRATGLPMYREIVRDAEVHEAQLQAGRKTRRAEGRGRD